MSCIVRDCRNVWYPESRIKFHCFPTNPIKRKTWLAMIKLKNKFYNSAKICSNHFKPEDYDPDRPNHLLNNAVPFCYKICECCNKSECINMPSTYQPTSSVGEDLQIMLPPQENNFLRQLLMKRQTSNNYWENVTTPASSSSSGALVPAARNATVIMPSRTPFIKDEKSEKTEKTRPVLKDFNVQVNLKTAREAYLVKKNKILQQRVRRHEKKLKDLKSIINIKKQQVP